jgi:hypothetical protein
VTRRNGWLLAWALFGLALRLAFALFYWVGQPLTHDEREYLALGRSVARGEGFTYPADEPSPGTGQQFGRAPGYPLFLAALGITERSDHVPRRVQVAQCVLGAVAIWLIGSIAGRAAGPRAAVTAAAIAAVYPPLVWISSYALSETLYSVVALSAARVLQGGERRPDTGSQTWHPIPAAVAGGLLGAAILTRPGMVFFLPVWGAWMVAKRSYGPAAVTLVVALLCVVPWTIRNHRVYGRWIAVASEGGITFWTGNHPLAVGDGDLAANLPLKQAELAFRAAHPGLTPEQMEPFYYRDALAWIRREPGAWAVLVARKAFYTAVPIGPSYALHSTKYVAASVVPYLLVLPAAIVGAWSWRRARRDGVSPAPLWLMAAATVLAGLVFFPQERFRIPVIDPALIVAAALLAGLRNHERTDRHSHV